MCLLVVVSGLGADDRLLVAANRDERVDRPAVPITVLRSEDPRILGGRDLVAGGTWLTVNEHGVVAGLTNTPTEGGPDRTKRSRGVLPLAAARHASAAEAVEALQSEVRPDEFNPAWLLIADRRSCFAVTIAGERPEVTVLPPGVHVLENRPPGCRSAKVRHVLEMIGPLPVRPDAAGLRRRLEAVLADHRRPRDAATDPRPPELLSACVHADGYGTRSSALIDVPGDPAELPSVMVSSGPACRASLVDRSSLWTAGPAEPGSDGGERLRLDRTSAPARGRGSGRSPR